MTLPDRLPPFVTASFVAAHLDQLVLVDVRFRREGHDPVRGHLEAHLPGAVRLDLDDDLSGEVGPGTGRHPLPTPEDFAAACARVGIGDDSHVVVYDEGHGAIAARLVWMLRVTGRDAAVLSGGLAGWPGAVDAGLVDAAPGSCSVVPWPAHELADMDLAGHLAAGPGTVLVDARSGDRFRGETEAIDARAGHVPGAINLPFEDNVDADGRLRDEAFLAARFATVAAAEDAAVSCGSGVTACHDILAMEQAGLPRPRLFVGSWSAWSADPSREVATGAA